MANKNVTLGLRARGGLSPLLVFFSLVFWGWLWGIPALKPLAIMMSS